MKKFNGTDYDGLLPLAYNALNSQQLDGKTFNEIQNLLTSTDLYLYTGTYRGTGQYGESNPTSITFPFEPILLLGGVFANIFYYDDTNTSVLDGNIAILTPISNTRYDKLPDQLYVKMSEDRKTISWYYDGKTNPALSQNNQNGILYLYAAIGGYNMGEQTEWLFTESQTWTVPKTGNYHLELYGNGGRSTYKGTYDMGSDRSGAATGGTSCQIYDSISLTKGSVVNIACYPYISGQNPRGSSFGSYSVAAGGDGTATYSTYGSQFVVTAGKGSGNKGVDGGTDTQYNYGAQVGRTFSSRIYSKTYGYSESAGNYDSNTNKYSPRAVYLSYLGN